MYEFASTFKQKPFGVPKRDGPTNHTSFEFTTCVHPVELLPHSSIRIPLPKRKPFAVLLPMTPVISRFAELPLFELPPLSHTPVQTLHWNPMPMFATVTRRSP